MKIKSISVTRNLIMIIVNMTFEPMPRKLSNSFI